MDVVLRQITRLRGLVAAEAESARTARVGLCLGGRPTPAQIALIQENGDLIDVYVRGDDVTFERIA